MPFIYIFVLASERLRCGGSAKEMVGARDIDELPKNAANYTALTPLWFLERAAQVHPTRNSLIHGSRHYTWQHTYHRCRRFASALSNRSIGLGNTVILYSLLLFFPSSLIILFFFFKRRRKRYSFLLCPPLLVLWFEIDRKHVFLQISSVK